MFILFIWMKAIEVANMYRYPATMNCDSINAMFRNDADGQSKYAYYAGLDSTYTIEKQGTGIYQCYCSAKGYAQLAEDSGADGLCHTYVW